MRSFRARLAARFTLTMAGGLLALAVLTWFAVRDTLDSQIDASLLNVASIQAASVTESPTGEMRFHEWELTPAEASQIRELNRFAQVWTEDGRSLLRTRYITQDLPLDRAALAKAGRGSLVWVEHRFQGMRVRSLYYPLARHGPAHGAHVLQVSAPLEARDRLLNRFTLFALAIVALVSLFTLVGSSWLADRAVRPVQEISSQAREISAGTLDRRISAYADSREYHGLVNVLNTMLARLYDAFEAQRRFTADASHELRSPLTALRGELELARRRRREAEEYERVIDSSLEEVDRLTRITEDLLTLARSDAGVLEPRPSPVDLARVSREVAERLRAAAAEKGAAVVAEADGAAWMQADEDLLRRLVWNLSSNALRFTPAGGTVRLRARTEGGHALLEVSDDGPGVPPADLERIFDRFYQVSQARTHDEGGVGTGLGLAIVRAIADLHRGTVSAANRPEGGAVFTFRAPVSEPG